MTTQNDTRTWPELAIGLYEQLTGRDAEITYGFDNLELYVPSSTSEDAAHARWKINGTVRISSRDGEPAKR